MLVYVEFGASRDPGNYAQRKIVAYPVGYVREKISLCAVLVLWSAYSNYIISICTCST